MWSGGRTLAAAGCSMAAAAPAAAMRDKVGSEFET